MATKQIDKQKAVLEYLRQVPSATLREIYVNVPFGYYCNENKHLGALLARMVKAGKVERIQKGVFKCSEPGKRIAHLQKKRNAAARFIF